jgi:protein-S-isoprenylcysteine O-methyltransferase Ste14
MVSTMLALRAFAGLLFLMLTLGATLFLTGGDLGYWQAWTFLAVFGAAVLAITLYLMARDPALLERRVAAGPLAEKEVPQKLIQLAAGLAFIAIFVICGLGHRFGWTRLSEGFVLAGNVLVALGLLVIFLVFKENTYTSGTIEVAPGQQVIATGPYRIVRHPMYSGAIVMLVGVPLAMALTAASGSSPQSSFIKESRPGQRCVAVRDHNFVMRSSSTFPSAGRRSLNFSLVYQANLSLTNAALCRGSASIHF